MNVLLLSGKISRDPVYRMTPSGVSTCRFTVGTRSEYKNKDGKYDMHYVDLLAWRKLADDVANNCVKGTEVFVKAHVTSGSYDGKDGKKVYTKDNIVDDVKILQAPAISAPFSSMGEDATEEIPF